PAQSLPLWVSGLVMRTSTGGMGEDGNGLDLDRPYQRARDPLRFLRAALAGEKVSGAYDTFTVNGFRLDPPPAPPPGLALAALRPGMVRLAATLADAAITNWLSPADVPTVRAVAGPDCELIARIFVCPTADTDAAPAVGRRMTAAYLAVPVYAAFHAWLGRGEVLRPMQEAWAAGDRKRALELVPDEVVDELLVHGSLDACRERVAEYHATGLDTPVIMVVPMPGVDEAAAVRARPPARSPWRAPPAARLTAGAVTAAGPTTAGLAAPAPRCRGHRGRAHRAGSPPQGHRGRVTRIRAAGRRTRPR